MGGSDILDGATEVFVRPDIWWSVFGVGDRSIYQGGYVGLFGQERSIVHCRLSQGSFAVRADHCYRVLVGTEIKFGRHHLLGGSNGEDTVSKRDVAECSRANDGLGL